jgi:hypothetical protein
VHEVLNKKKQDLGLKKIGIGGAFLSIFHHVHVRSPRAIAAQLQLN